jgi:DNA primase small subunit
MKYVMEDIILQYTYPRIDAEVSKHRNHLLKAPFCVHPKTGRICVPIDPERIDEFDPDTVPTVSQLLRELDAGTPESTGEEHSGLSLRQVTGLSRLRFLHRLGKDVIEAIRRYDREACCKPYG